MAVRTDLALESFKAVGQIDGVVVNEHESDGVKTTEISIQTQTAAEKLGRSCGRYVTVELMPYMANSAQQTAYDTVKTELEKFLPESGMILVVGLGNSNITPDALGPAVVNRIIATRHISKQLANEIGLIGLRSVAVLAPGVLGQTGIETAEVIRAVVASIKPAAVLVIDSLAAQDLKRLGCTVQISNVGIAPGSGIGNRRFEINRDVLKVPVFSLGVPTVVHASTLVYELTGETNDTENREMIVTPREIDSVIDRASQLLSRAINCALHPDVDEDILLSCV
ncbi:MAG: GPR endopeptidase [bacterium]|nr:GPR endopeptidase [bacterium]